MKIEHVAFNVSDPIRMADWYVKHLGMEIVRKLDAMPHTHFLGDGSGAMLIELYHNPPDQVPAYASMDPLLLHLAFVSEDPERAKPKLQAAGATFVSEQRLDDGSHLVMLRDPWGLAIQLCKRGKPMLKA